MKWKTISVNWRIGEQRVLVRTFVARSCWRCLARSSRSGRSTSMTRRAGQLRLRRAVEAALARELLDARGERRVCDRHAGRVRVAALLLLQRRRFPVLRCRRGRGCHCGGRQAGSRTWRRELRGVRTMRMQLAAAACGRVAGGCCSTHWTRRQRWPSNRMMITTLKRALHHLPVCILLEVHKLELFLSAITIIE